MKDCEWRLDNWGLLHLSVTSLIGAQGANESQGWRAAGLTQQKNPFEVGTHTRLPPAFIIALLYALSDLVRYILRVAYLFLKVTLQQCYQQPSWRVLFMLERKRRGELLSGAPWREPCLSMSHSAQWHMLSLWLINHWRSDVHRWECSVSFDAWLAFLSLRLTFNITPAVQLNSHCSRTWLRQAIAQTDSLG